MTHHPSHVIRSSELRARRGKPRIALRGELNDIRAENVAQGNYLDRALKSINSSRTASFVVNKNLSNQSITSSAPVKVTFSNELVNVGGFFGSDRWTPPGGKILVIANVTVAAATDIISAHLYKNGLVWKSASAVLTATGAGSALVAAIDDASGSDYYEVYVDSLGLDASYTVGGGPSETRFEGTMI